MYLDAGKLKEALKIVEPGAESTFALFQGGWISTKNRYYTASYKFETGIEGIFPFDGLLDLLKKAKVNVEVTQHGSS